VAYPLSGLAKVDIEALKHSGLVVPLWAEGESFRLVAFLSHTEKFSAYRISDLKKENLLLIDKKDLAFNSTDVEIKMNLNIVQKTARKVKSIGSCSLF